MAFKKLNLICVSVIGLAQVQDLWNIKNIGEFLKGTEKISENFWTWSGCRPKQ